MQQVRQGANLSQNDVAKLTYIHADTLRRIENGKNPPRLETLRTLSILYKVDLLYLLSECTNKNIYNDIFLQIDRQIIEKNNESYEKIKDSIEKLKHIKTDDLFLIKQKKQLILFGEILLCDLNQIRLDQLIKCIRISIPEFEIKHFVKNTYSYMELRMLIIISLHYANDGTSILVTKYYIFSKIIL